MPESERRGNKELEPTWSPVDKHTLYLTRTSATMYMYQPGNISWIMAIGAFIVFLYLDIKAWLDPAENKKRADRIERCVKLCAT